MIKFEERFVKIVDENEGVKQIFEILKTDKETALKVLMKVNEYDYVEELIEIVKNGEVESYEITHEVDFDLGVSAFLVINDDEAYTLNMAHFLQEYFDVAYCVYDTVHDAFIVG